ncbi:alpha/beta fold hydrolase [Altererythrobacter oceanensis]|uniref:Alpha/beta fold hydrolase n=2 Tax=Qipengyuania oceanensis TaxID=1463597 RepID=A0A844YIE2_9SPHN|nr:alpha/beta hydrolase [Qipengyuania oceanensis]MXO63513.1 alpha/beta fold hydrolase [Qipengyuania oceanensis]
MLLGLVALLVVAFLVLRVPDTDPAEMRAKYGAAPSQFLTLDDGQVVHLRDEGPKDALPVVLLHGSNADLHTWQPWVDRLKADYRVIRYDQIGHGLTGPSVSGNYERAEFEKTIDQVAGKLGLERFVLAGNSMGGGIAMGYAIDHPERLAGLVLVDAAGADIQREGGGNLAFTLAGMPVVGDVLSQLLPRSLVDKSFRQSVSNQAIVTDEAVDRYWELARYPGNRGATRKRFSAPRIPFAEAQLRAVSVPTLVMWGEEDSLIRVEAARWYDGLLPNSTLVVYPGIGHIPMEEAPDRSASDLRKFLSGIEREAPSSHGL